MFAMKMIEKGKLLVTFAALRNTNNGEKWNLADEPHLYKYSSASFYYTGIDESGFLENYMNVCNEDD